MASAAGHSQSPDPCGGTGGNGAIISVANNSFILRLNEGGDLVVNLPEQATFETASGHGSILDLAPGDRVTLVGDLNLDGTFTANTVVRCKGAPAAVTLTEGTQVEGASQTTPAVAQENAARNQRVRSTIDVATILLVVLIWLGTSAFLLLKREKSIVYLLFFTIFYIYLYKVLDYTLLQFQSLLLLQHFLPTLILEGVEAGGAVNLVPLTTLTRGDVNTSLLNILLMIPFGFGLPFITNFGMKQVVVAGLLLSIVIELLQLVTGLMADTTFRIADINDVIFNTMGVAVGYLLFAGFGRLFRLIFPNWTLPANPILRYVSERPQID